MICYKNNHKKGKCSVEKLEKKQKRLYEIKRQMIKKAIADGLARKEGIHSWEKVTGEINSYVFVKFPQRSFHIPLEDEDIGLVYLRQYEKRNCTIKIDSISSYKALKICNQYLIK